DAANGSDGNWLSDNVLHPLANSALLEPYNALANLTNCASDLLVHKELLPKVHLYDVPKSQFLGLNWFAQSISGGIGMIVPYTIAGKLTGGSMRALGEGIGAEGRLAMILKSDRTAQILGAAAYGGLMDTHPGETHLGNALATAAGFSIFEGGGMLSHSLPL